MVGVDASEPRENPRVEFGGESGVDIARERVGDGRVAKFPRVVVPRKGFEDFGMFDSSQAVDVVARDSLGWFEVEVRAGELRDDGVRRRGKRLWRRVKRLWRRGRRKSIEQIFIY